MEPNSIALAIGVSSLCTGGVLTVFVAFLVREAKRIRA